MKSNTAQKSIEKILITGAAGFIGSHVTDFFCKKKMNIYCLIKESSNLQFIKDLPINIIYGDITESDRLESIFKKLDMRGCKLMLSNSYNEYIKKLYQDYKIITLDARRVINCNAAKRGKINVLLILNY